MEENLVACVAAEECAFCGEGHAYLYQGVREGVNPTLLRHLGLDIRRPAAHRIRKCDHCQAEYAGAGEMNFSARKTREAYADIGSPRFPLPSDLREKTFLQYCEEQLNPEVLASSPLIEKTPQGYRWRPNGPEQQDA